MRTSPYFLGACLLSCTSAPSPSSRLPLPASRDYAGVYISTPQEDYFTPCGIDVGGDSWSLRFRENERQAPFLNKVTAIRGYAPLMHFIRVRGTLGPPGRYNLGFQTRELAVDSVLAVKETLEPCRGFGAPAAWNRMPPRPRNSKGIALSNDRRFAALIDTDGFINIWSTETGQLVTKLGNGIGDVNGANYGPIVFSNDGKLLAAGGDGGVVRVWQPRDGKIVFSLALKDSAAVRQIVFNRRGTMLAATNPFSTIVWSMKTGTKLAEFGRGNDFMGKFFFVGDEGLLSTADSARFRFRSKLDAEPVTRPGTRAGATEHMATSPDGRSFAVNGWGDSVFLWSVDKGPGPVLPVPGFVTGVIAFSPNGKLIATAGGMFSLYVWDARTGAPIKAFYNFPSALSGAWFSADGKSIITTSTFDDRFRIVYIDPKTRPASQATVDDSLTAQFPLGPPPSTAPRTVGGIVTSSGPNPRAVAGAEVEISEAAAPDSVVARTTTSPGGYFSFNGIRFRHVVIRVRSPGFSPGVKYIHLNRWADEGPWRVELTPGL